MTPDADDTPPLDDATIGRIAAALDTPAADAAALARVKQRVLRRIAADATPRHLTVPAGDDGWAPFGPGLRWKVLHRDGGICSYLVRLAPGASLPPHRHPVDEECVVLEGELAVGDLRVAAGGFHLGRAGVLHDRVRSEGGALIFLRGAEPDVSLLV